MQVNFVSLEDHNDDIIRIDRLIDFIPSENWDWDSTMEINLDDVSIAIHESLPEVSEPYGDTWEFPPIEHKSRDWHIGRIIYFINHPEEIRDIYIDNECEGLHIFPKPVIVDGWHRYAAARWLYDQGKLTEIHCRYNGRVDVLDYLKGKLIVFDELA